MKKLLCIILSMIMIFGTCSTALAAEEVVADDTSTTGFDLNGLLEDLGVSLDGFNFGEMELPDDYTMDVEDLIADGTLSKNVDFMGVTVDYLYNGVGPITWTNVDIGYSELLLAKANLNTYLQRFMKSYFTNERLFTSEYCLKITNYIGNMLNPNFHDINYNDIRFDFSTEPIKSDDFFELVSKHSGLGDIIQYNLVYAGVTAYQPIFTLLGTDFRDVFPSQKTNGIIIGRELLQGMFEKVLEVGPITYICDLVLILTRTYSAIGQQVANQVFKMRIENGDTDIIQLQELNEVFDLIFNFGDEDAYDKLQFLTFPSRKIASSGATIEINDNYDTDEENLLPNSPTYLTVSSGSTEVFLYLMAYFNLNSLYKDNKSVGLSYQESINNNPAIAQVDKDRISSIIGSFFGDANQLDTFMQTLVNLFSENIDLGLNGFTSSIKNSISKFIESIVSFFDRLFEFMTPDFLE